jgi:hypothetical protein
MFLSPLASDAGLGAGLNECASCEALWRNYRDAMIAHLEAIDELELAQFTQDFPKAGRMERLVFETRHVREAARVAATAHEASHRGRWAA